jgi:hypothetical protein
MSRATDTPIPDPAAVCDVYVLLRAHAEARWLSHEVVPVLRELEDAEALPEEHLSAALAYLEVLWIESHQRAAETDEAWAELTSAGCADDRVLRERARSYHAAVRRLRARVARRVARLMSDSDEPYTRERVSF